jgi:hypothetical protein
MRLRSGTITKVPAKKTTRKSKAKKAKSFKPAKCCPLEPEVDKGGSYKPAKRCPPKPEVDKDDPPAKGCVPEPPTSDSLELGPKGKLVHLPDVSEWASIRFCFPLTKHQLWDYSKMILVHRASI